MQPGFLDVLLLIGVIQGFVIAAIFLTIKRKLSSIFLAGILIVLGLSSLNTITYDLVDIQSLTSEQLAILTNFPPELIMLLGPLIYFYCKSIFEKNFKVSKSDLYHFIPVIIDILPLIKSIVLYYYPVYNSQYAFINGYDIYVVIPQFLSLTFYILMSWKYLRKTKLVADKRTFNWIRDFLIGLSIINFVWFLFLPFFLSSWQSYLLETLYYYPIYIPVVVFMYFLTIRLMTSNLTFRPNLYSSTEIDEKINLLHSLIMTERLYANSDLTLSQLSSQSNIPAKTISFILNHSLQVGFNEYINKYRVNEALAKIKSGSANNLTVEGIGLDVGFSSRSTFYRSFKQVTGQHPSIYFTGK